MDVEELIKELIAITDELNYREASNNLGPGGYRNWTWCQLCQRAIEILEILKS